MESIRFVFFRGSFGVVFVFFFNFFSFEQYVQVVKRCIFIFPKNSGEVQQKIFVERKHLWVSCHVNHPLLGVALNSLIFFLKKPGLYIEKPCFLFFFSWIYLRCLEKYTNIL